MSEIYKRRYKKALMALFGNCCFLCHANMRLQFAHKFPTGLMGAGRGSIVRYNDIIENYDKYFLLCEKCHDKFDKENPIKLEVIAST